MSESLHYPASLLPLFPSCTKSVTVKTSTGVDLKLKQKMSVLLGGKEVSELPLETEGKEVIVRRVSSMFITGNVII